MWEEAGLGTLWVRAAFSGRSWTWQGSRTFVSNPGSCISTPPKLSLGPVLAWGITSSDLELGSSGTPRQTTRPTTTQRIALHRHRYILLEITSIREGAQVSYPKLEPPILNETAPWQVRSKLPSALNPVRETSVLTAPQSAQHSAGIQTLLDVRITSFDDLSTRGR